MWVPQPWLGFASSLSESMDLCPGITWKCMEMELSQPPGWCWWNRAAFSGVSGKAGGEASWVPGLSASLTAKKQPGRFDSTMLQGWLAGFACLSWAAVSRVLGTLEARWRRRHYYLLFLNTYHPELPELTGSL